MSGSADRTQQRLARDVHDPRQLSAREALVKMCTLPLLAGDNISAAFVVPTVASSVDIVVHLGTEADGRRRVREIVGVTGRIEGDIIETSDLFTLRHGRLQRGEGYPPHEERFAAAGLDLAGLLGHSADGRKCGVGRFRRAGTPVERVRSSDSHAVRTRAGGVVTWAR